MYRFRVRVTDEDAPNGVVEFTVTTDKTPAKFADHVVQFGIHAHGAWYPPHMVRKMWQVK